MSSVPKGERTASKEEFDALHYRIHDDAVDMIGNNFHAKHEVAEKNQSYIQSASKTLMSLVWDLVYHIKVANSLYPTTTSEAPQIFAVFYLSPIDSFIKTVKGIKYYGRYMDDMLIISESKEELKKLLEEIKEQLAKLKLEINERKTHITKLSRGFTFMQVKYNVDRKKANS